MEQPNDPQRRSRRQKPKDVRITLKSGTIIRVISILLMVGVILFMMYGLK